ncbi:MAG TPA: molybdopterin-synthase adenylyltransferase MoeB [Candidatus Dormibacteraeota bacterium]|nr:molybdopterin-synthase adenylyltransferase MoeB [Candidatus Dormibacteraeota bacterium]
MIDGNGAALDFTDEQVERYSRHIALSEIGPAGQRKLRSTRVVVLGAGGLGAPVAMYLAASGVGRLGIVDYDRVDLSNLQRQIIHPDSSRGQAKAEVARRRAQELNPDIDVVAHDVMLSRDNAMDVLANYDIIVDGTDNFQTRYLANDAAYLLGKPLVHGSIFRFEGQVSDFVPGQGCYRCLYPEPPPPGLVPSCRQAGVLAALPGVIGTIQAVETIKLITGAGRPLVGRLLLHDTLAMTFREVRLRRNQACVLCGDHPTVRELIDYEAFTGGPLTAAARL